MKPIIKIPNNARVFILEDNEERMDWFRHKLGHQPGYRRASNALQAITILSQEATFDIMFLDHDLSFIDEGQFNEHTYANSGSRVAASMAEHGWLAEHVIIHSWNPAGAANMAKVLGNGVHVIPFGQFDIEIE